MLRSKLPETISLPPDANATDEIASLSPINVRSNWPVPRSQILIDLSKLPDTMVRPLGENATALTGPECPERVSTRCPAPGPFRITANTRTARTTSSAAASDNRITRACLSRGQTMSSQSAGNAGKYETGLSRAAAPKTCFGCAAARDSMASFLCLGSAVAAFRSDFDCCDAAGIWVSRLDGDFV